MKYCVNCDIEMEPNIIQVCDDKKKVCSFCGSDELKDLSEYGEENLNSRQDAIYNHLKTGLDMILKRDGR